MRDPKSLAIVTLGLTTAFLAGAVCFRAGPAEAQQAPGGGTYANQTVNSNNRFIAATGSVGSGMSVLWLVDTEGKRVLVYGTNNLGKDIEFRAARNVEWDLKLDFLNDESQYQVEDLKRLAEKQRNPAAPAPKEGGGPGTQNEGGK
jgi:hypothetical protein